MLPVDILGKRISDAVASGFWSVPSVRSWTRAWDHFRADTVPRTSHRLLQQQEIKLRHAVTCSCQLTHRFQVERVHERLLVWIDSNGALEGHSVDNLAAFAELRLRVFVARSNLRDLQRRQADAENNRIIKKKLQKYKEITVSKSFKANLNLPSAIFEVARL